MNNKKPLLSYALATIASVCFLSGFVILKTEGSV